MSEKVRLSPRGRAIRNGLSLVSAAAIVLGAGCGTGGESNNKTSSGSGTTLYSYSQEPNGQAPGYDGPSQAELDEIHNAENLGVCASAALRNKWPEFTTDYDPTGKPCPTSDSQRPIRGIQP